MTELWYQVDIRDPEIGVIRWRRQAVLMDKSEVDAIIATLTGMGYYVRLSSFTRKVVESKREILDFHYPPRKGR